MSSIVSVFFQNTGSPVEVSATIAHILNCKFQLEEETDFTRHASYALGVELILIENHGLVDDCGIPFSMFQYELDLHVDSASIDGDVADFYHQSFGRYLFELISKRLGWNCMLVFNLQRLVSISPEK